MAALLFALWPQAPPRAHATDYGAGAPIPFLLLPPDNPWNTRVDTLPLDPNSADYIAHMAPGTGLHPDFGTVWEGAPIGIPYVVVPGDQPKVPIDFYYADESDPGPYPIPPDAPVEGAGGPFADGDRHVLVLDADNQLLYEVYDAHKDGDHWHAGSGAVFDLTSNALRPDGWTSADAAGLPILPGLVRYDEAVEKGVIEHALRFTVAATQRAYVYPATHFASDETDPDLPPMGLRVRLKASYDISGFPHELRVVLQALKTYGMMVADNGADWYVGGAPDPRWDDEALSAIREVKGSDFEVVDSRSLLPAAFSVTPAGDGHGARGRGMDAGGLVRRRERLGVDGDGGLRRRPGAAGPRFRQDLRAGAHLARRREVPGAGDGDQRSGPHGRGERRGPRGQRGASGTRRGKAEPGRRRAAHAPWLVRRPRRRHVDRRRGVGRRLGAHGAAPARRQDVQAGAPLPARPRPQLHRRRDGARRRRGPRDRALQGDGALKRPACRRFGARPQNAPGPMYASRSAPTSS